jgi:putative protease
MVDGRVKELGLEKYLLSPKDLGAFDLIPDLVEAGISCFKIEGRYKGADYVAATVEKYRKVLDSLLEGHLTKLDRTDKEELAFTYSRGFSNGWLAGDDHQELSHGVFPGHRGLRVGTVERVSGWSVFVRLDDDAPTAKAGDWMVFDQGDPEGDEPRGGIFAVEPPHHGLQEIRFGDPGPNLADVKPGNGLWKSHDSALKRRLLRYMEADRKVSIDLVVRGRPGAPIEVAAEDAFGRVCTVLGEAPLELAQQAPLGADVLREKLGAFGETRYALRRLDVHLEGNTAIRPSELKRLRRRIVEQLEAQPIPVATHAVQAVDVQQLVPAIPRGPEQQAELVPLCRTLEQVDAVLGLGFREVYLDFMELVGLGEAVKKCRAAGARVVIATMRIQKPGEEPFDRRFEGLKPDGILARHLGALHHYRGRSNFALHGDFSLNATNVITGRTLLALGLKTLTPSYDLNVSQLEDLASGLPSDRLEVTIHQHLPLYHTEYCLYAHNLSEGKDFRDCGRPCEEHRVNLKDGKGLEHPVLVDVGCRNTVFNARAQSAAPHMKTLLAKGIRRFRMEFVWETPDEVRQVAQSYRALLAGERSAANVVKDVGALERYGVTSGTFAVL